MLTSPWRAIPASEATFTLGGAMTGYLRDLSAMFDQVECRLDALPISGDKAIEMAAAAILTGAQHGRKVLIVGNGGSAAIASHVATDLVKNAEVRAMVFTDSSMLTCLANDHGYPEVYAEPVKLFGEPGDTLIAISSSGNSDNILRAAEEAREIGMVIITLSGFDPDNRLRKMGRLSIYVPAHAYGMVEVTHLALLHAVIDTVIARRTPR